MSEAHAPKFLAVKDRATSPKFIKDTKEDILAVIELLYGRGMWSKYHYEKWKAEIEASEDEVLLHSVWDDIVNGAMGETDAGKIYEAREYGLADKLKS